MKELEIELHDYSYSCADGCCDYWGTTVKVNGEELEETSTDLPSMLENILTHLGYKVNIIQTAQHD
jgi:hypothetical protein